MGIKYSLLHIFSNIKQQVVPKLFITPFQKYGHMLWEAIDRFRISDWIKRAITSRNYNNYSLWIYKI
jgi:hypothetical protein